jgi:DNA invertase Pin-like site-specific DNA recombinase
MTTPAGTGPRTAAIWARVSSTDGSQTNENQLHVLRQWATNRGLGVAAEFITEDSGWSTGNGKGTEFDRARKDLIRGAQRGDYSVILIWSLDRLSRRGIKDTLAVLDDLWDHGAEVWSDREPWLGTTDPRLRGLIVSIFAWVAEQESARRSERIQLGMARARREIAAELAAGKTPTRRIGGRKPGSKDRKPRRREGYLRPKAPPPEWMPQAQAMYDEVGADGRPVHHVQDIAAQVGTNTKSLYRRLNRGGPGGKARAGKQAGS